MILKIISKALSRLAGAVSFTRKKWWAGLDLNQRRREPANLQSAPFDHSGTYPFFACGESEKEAREHHLRKYFLLCFSIV